MFLIRASFNGFSLFAPKNCDPIPIFTARNFIIIDCLSLTNNKNI